MLILVLMENKKRRMNDMEPDLNIRMDRIEAEMDALKNRVSGMEQRKRKVRKIDSIQGKNSGSKTQ